MNTDKNKIIVLGVMMAVLAGVIFWQFTKGAGTTPPPTAPQAPRSADAPETSASGAAPQVVQSQFKDVDVNLDQLVQEIKEVDFAYLPEGRNPMLPLVGRTYFAKQNGDQDSPAGLESFELMAIAQRMSLTGLIWDPADPVAVIDNTIVRPGHVFADLDIRVSEIRPTSVTLEVEDSLVELTLEDR